MDGRTRRRREPRDRKDLCGGRLRRKRLGRERKVVKSTRERGCVVQRESVKSEGGKGRGGRGVLEKRFPSSATCRNRFSRLLTVIWVLFKELQITAWGHCIVSYLCIVQHRTGFLRCRARGRGTLRGFFRTRQRSRRYADGHGRDGGSQSHHEHSVDLLPTTSSLTSPPPHPQKPNPKKKTNKKVTTKKHIISDTVSKLPSALHTSIQNSSFLPPFFHPPDHQKRKKEQIRNNSPPPFQPYSSRRNGWGAIYRNTHRNKGKKKGRKEEDEGEGEAKGV